MIIGHGDNIYDYGVKVRHNFSSNVFRGMQMPGLKEYLQHQINVIDNYPPTSPIIQEQHLSKLLGIKANEVMITNGATEAIYLVAAMFGSNTMSSIMEPTFSEYSDACRMYGHKTRTINSFDEAKNVDVVWLCNPNNPTGSVLKRNVIDEWTKAHPQKILIVDQSYECFSHSQLMTAEEAVQSSNIIQIHSMTKQFAIPGLRLGYVVANSDLIKRIHSCIMPWSVNSLALSACDYLINHYNDRPKVDDYLKETQRLRQMLNELKGVTAMETETNFMLVNIGTYDCHKLCRKLVERYSILIRPADNFAGLDEHYIRIAAQAPEENDLLVQAIKDILKV